MKQCLTWVSRWVEREVGGEPKRRPPARSGHLFSLFSFFIIFFRAKPDERGEHLFCIRSDVISRQIVPTVFGKVPVDCTLSQCVCAFVRVMHLPGHRTSKTAAADALDQFLKKTFSSISLAFISFFSSSRLPTWWCENRKRTRKSLQIKKRLKKGKSVYGMALVELMISRWRGQKTLVVRVNERHLGRFLWCYSLLFLI